MKKWRKFFRSLFVRHIAGPDPLVAADPLTESATDLETLRFSVWRYLRSAKEHEQFLLGYSEKYAPVMDELRMEGWLVRLHVATDGTLAYMISSDHSRIAN